MKLSFYKKLKISVVVLITMFCLKSQVLFSAEIYAAPVPWVPEGDKTATGNLTDGISFMNLPDSGEILIYTISGNLVKRIEFSNPSGGRVRWYGENENNADVASGVYFWIVKYSGANKTGKLIIIR